MLNELRQCHATVWYSFSQFLTYKGVINVENRSYMRRENFLRNLVKDLENLKLEFS